MFLWIMYIISFVVSYIICKKLRNEAESNDWIDVFMSIGLSFLGPFFVLAALITYIIEKFGIKTEQFKKPPKWL